MHKISALALVALSAAMPALAQSQSNLTVYGILDAAVRTQSGLTAGYAGAPNNTTVVNSGVGPTSRWGLRGQEDLGGGLKATFNLESTLGVDVGTSGSAAGFFDRAAVLGLAGNWGAVTAGRQNTLVADSAGIADPIGLRFAGLNPNIQVTSLTGHRLGIEYGATNTNAASNRVNNSIKYSGTFGGLTVRAMYSFGESAISSTRQDTKGLGLNYAAGDLALTSAYTQFHDANGLELDAATIGAAWKTGGLRLMLNYGRNQGDTTTTTQTTNKVLSFGANYAFNNQWSFNGGYYKVDRERTGLNKDGFTRLIGFVDYSLSRRTKLYLEMDSTKWKGNYQGVGNKARSNGMSLGVTHSF
ncbi:porin [Acidovorax sp. CCYZU-2555]|uniref:porin n=1 Tax=Acidovorax sp. CCYZU-2555 TaxID=2835042 RepID=UPI001BD0CA22|nr:porin [Acidovorax sp. CCYZU-2555]MBS7777880.1 porin [Acidovorax sp. CCYZU-2555]